MTRKINRESALASENKRPRTKAGRTPGALNCVQARKSGSGTERDEQGGLREGSFCGEARHLPQQEACGILGLAASKCDSSVALWPFSFSNPNF